ncbi:MAG: hypothetical protein LBQ06_06635 [Frankiaceae bacterium]|nr:hypothetical protein [Frankiaceae bacterium]
MAAALTPRRRRYAPGPEDLAAAVIVWRPWISRRLIAPVAVLFFGLLAMLCGLNIRSAPTAWGLYLACALVGYLAVWQLAELRRKTTLDDRRIRVQGRFLAREIELSDIRQVGRTPIGQLWVQTRTPRPNGGDTTVLYMLPLVPYLRPEPMASPELAQEIRRRAARAGAVREPERSGAGRPPGRKGLLLGA